MLPNAGQFTNLGLIKTWAPSRGIPRDRARGGRGGARRGTGGAARMQQAGGVQGQGPRGAGGRAAELGQADAADPATKHVALVAGTWKLWCNIGNHEQLGMVANVTVSDG